MSKPTVAIVGRPNVGKSTLFNRIQGGRKAIVSDRGRHHARPALRRRRMGRAEVLAGGHRRPGARLRTHSMDQAIRQQVEMAVEEADLVLFVVDGKAGLHPVDGAIAERLRKSQAPGARGGEQARRPRERHRAVRLLQPRPRRPDAERRPASAREAATCSTSWSSRCRQGRGGVGRGDQGGGRGPAERGQVLAHQPAARRGAARGGAGGGHHPRRDRLALRAKAGSTSPSSTPPASAGARRWTRTSSSTPRCGPSAPSSGPSVCVLVVDAKLGLHNQDLRIATEAWEQGCGLIILVNKWDLIEEKDTNTASRGREDADREGAVPRVRAVPVRLGARRASGCASCST